MKRSIIGFVIGVVSTLALLVVAASASREMAPSASALSADDAVADFHTAPAPARQAEPRMKKSLGAFGAGPGGGGYAVGSATRGAVAEAAPALPPAPEDMASGGFAEEMGADQEEDGLGGAPAATRSWFPETFLFEPLVVTNDAGEATVPVRIPDRLTRWRVLGLAHSRTGEQSGTVTTFQGTLPVYVEPVLPGFLVAGDEVRLPIQVVNTTATDVTGALSFEVSGARAIESGSGTVRVPANGSMLRYAVVRAESAGTAIVRARFGRADALVKELPIVPAGRPVSSSAGGTLAAARTVALDLPADAIPSTSRVRLTVFPGALAVLRSELGALSGRGGVDEDAYGLLLTGRAPQLLDNLGERADAVALRKTTVVLQQRALRHARVADPATAALLAEAALAHPDNAILSRLGERLLVTLAEAQRPDGTFQGGHGWTLQRLLVATAEGVRALHAGSGTEAGARRAEAARVRAAGAFERYLGQVQDGYTAAAILSSGAVSGSVAQALREKVRAAINTHADGSRYLAVDAGVVRPDGARPSVAEATALAVLGLQGAPDAPVADLGAFLLSAYSPEVGWGEGRTNLSAIRAVVELFRAPLPGQVRVVLEQSGRVVAEGTLEPRHARELLTFEARGGAVRTGPFTVRAEPAVPGLGFRLELQSWVPWKQEAPNGLELAVATPATFRVGEAALLQVTATGPAHTEWSLRTALPAGVQVDRPALDVQVGNGTLRGYAVEDGALTLSVPPRGPGSPFTAQVRVFPTLGGRLHAAASTLQVNGRPDWVAYAPSAQWVVR